MDIYEILYLIGFLIAGFLSGWFSKRRQVNGWYQKAYHDAKRDHFDQMKKAVEELEEARKQFRKEFPTK